MWNGSHIILSYLLAASSQYFAAIEVLPIPPIPYIATYLYESKNCPISFISSILPTKLLLWGIIVFSWILSEYTGLIFSVFPYKFSRHFRNFISNVSKWSYSFTKILSDLFSLISLINTFNSLYWFNSSTEKSSILFVHFFWKKIILFLNFIALLYSSKTPFPNLL